MDYDTNDSLNPDTGELLQQEDSGPLMPVHVSVDGSVRVHQLPPRVATTRNVTIGDGSGGPDTFECLAAEDPRRQYFYVSCTGNPIMIAHDKQSLTQGIGAILPVGLLLPLPTSAPIYAKCNVGAATSVVSYWSGEWAD